MQRRSTHWLATCLLLSACSAGGGDAGPSSNSDARGGTSGQGGQLSNPPQAGSAGNTSKAGAGSGGAAGSASGGSSGAGGSAGGDGASGDPCGADGLVLCDDFEQGESGTRPSAAPWLAKGPECGDASYVAQVDSAQAKSGTKSLLSQGAKGSNQACALMADLGMRDDFWIRAQIRFGAGATFTAHEVTVLELGETKSDDPEVRVGFRGDNSCNPTGVELAMTKGLSGEATGCTGFQLAAETWYCFEVHIQKLPNKLTGELYIDGQEQPYKLHGQDVELVEGQVMTPKFLRVGLQAYSSDYATTPLHLDDIAVGSQRIGCP